MDPEISQVVSSGLLVTPACSTHVPFACFDSYPLCFYNFYFFYKECKLLSF
jgi:hypothetical protein